MSSESSFPDDRCYACGIDLEFDEYENEVIVSQMSGRQYCSMPCFTSGKKFEPPKIDEEDPLTVPVRGKCNGSVINGTASFDMHGTVRLKFRDPSLKGSFEVPKLYLQIVKELYSDSVDEENE